jgi:hypothetical protein
MASGPVAPAGCSRGDFHALAPSRILDTRNGTGGLSTKVGRQSPVDVQVGGRGGVPAEGAEAVVLNVTATEATESSFLTLSPGGAQPTPNASNLNFSAGQNIPNLVTVKLGPGGKVKVWNQNGAVHVIFDVVGWYGDGTRAAGSFFVPLAPSRILDTRSGTGGVGKVQAQAPTSVQVAGRGGVPATGASAVVMNVTVTEATQPSFLTVYPSGQSPPNASNLNFAAGQNVPNLVTVKLGAGGKVNIWNQNGATDVIFDVVGWFSETPPSGALRMVPISPERVLDTRLELDADGWPLPVSAGDPLEVQLADPGSDINAVVMNVTVTEGTEPSFLTIYPGGQAPPNASNLNFGPDQNVPNLVTVKLGPDGTVNIWNQNGDVHVILDIVGVYVTRP